MTLIIAVPAQDGVVFGSDSQVTTGAVRATSTKIFRLNEHALWGGAGEVALIQRMSEFVDDFPKKDQPLTSIRDALSMAVKEQLQTLLTMDFRTQFVKTHDEYLALHPVDFLFVEFKEKPRILHILSNGTPEWIEDRFAATGNGDLFAHALLQKYAGTRLTCENAKLLAFKVIEEAIQIGAYGLGPPVTIWTATQDGAKQISEAELAALEDSARALRQLAVNLLASNLKVVKSSSTGS